MQTVDPLMDGINELRRQRVNFTVKNNRLRFHPKHAYKSLSEARHLFIKQNRAAIKAAVQRGLPALPRAIAPSASAPVAPIAATPVEAEPVMYTHYADRRVTQADVEAAGVSHLPKRLAYERARDWIEEQRLAAEAEWHRQIWHNSVSTETAGPRVRARGWEDFAYD